MYISPLKQKIRVFWKKILHFLFPKKIPDNILRAYHRDLREIRSKAWHLYRIDLDKFNNEEFIQYTQIKLSVDRNLGNYEGLAKIIELLEVCFDATESYLLISDTEVRFRSPMQKTIYRFITETLNKEDNEKALKVIDGKIRPLTGKIKTDHGRLVLTDYLDAIDTVSQYPLGFDLLRTFRTISDTTELYGILRTIYDLARTFKKSEVQSIQQIEFVVQENIEVFKKLNGLLSVPKEHRNIASYARILQYIGLKNRYQKEAKEFEDLLKYLKDWQRIYKKIKFTQSKFSPYEYKLPPDFKNPIPAFEIYKKYKKHL
ncbi:hypothetical protein FEK30_08070 [Picosynechococcus sp. PCC 11901]|uniref:hypothetical protein n=1 Tax=Picosynechococcus sp. PCC 11901 TaxID=2579791 RepID=UPI0010FBD21C|nr:hypothetical protein [Picosynechococcus sp. PCC 11901]QCS49399.1 hypothetical protein FEK30_08070 [Picosynechococcus sp. PCC 11901]